MFGFPITYLFGIGAFFIIIVVGTIIVLRPKGRDKTLTFLFKRNDEIVKLRGNNFSGLIQYDGGGYVEQSAAKMDVITGRATLEIGNSDYRRPSEPGYIVRVGDSSPMRVTNNKIHVDGITEDEYKARENLALENARTEAAVKTNNIDSLQKLIGFALVLGAICIVVEVVVIAIKGL